MSGATPPADQVVEVEQIAVMGYTLRRNYGLQYIGLLKAAHEALIRKLFVHPLLPT